MLGARGSEPNGSGESGLLPLSERTNAVPRSSSCTWRGTASTGGSPRPSGRGTFSGEASAGSAVGATAEGGVALRLSESDFLDEEALIASERRRATEARDRKRERRRAAEEDRRKRELAAASCAVTRRATREVGRSVP